MRLLFRQTVGFLLLVSVPFAVSAQSFPTERLQDWEFRFYVCKSVVINASILFDMMAKYQINDQVGIDKMKSQLGPSLVKAMTQSEKEYQFSDGELWFISDLTFAVVGGIVAGGYELSDRALLNVGNGACIHAIDSFSK